MGKTSPTQRSLKVCRERGWIAQVVEKWNPHAKVRQDLFGIVDILCLTPTGTVAIQACAGASHAARRTKALAEPRLRAMLAAGWTFEIWSFSKRGPRGARKRFELRTEPITVEQIECATDTETTISGGL